MAKLAKHISYLLPKFLLASDQTEQLKNVLIQREMLPKYSALGSMHVKEAGSGTCRVFVGVDNDVWQWICNWFDGEGLGLR